MNREYEEHELDAMCSACGRTWAWHFGVRCPVGGTTFEEPVAEPVEIHEAADKLRALLHGAGRLRDAATLCAFMAIITGDDEVAKQRAYVQLAEIMGEPLPLAERVLQ